ncbi:4Fe-4S dicluster domain-containing protein, partial [Chloroflexota bacterium]
VVLPYDEAIRVVDDREYIAAGACPCRHLGDLSGRPCSKPKVDMCMYFGSFAKFIVSRGFAHVLSKEDARQRIEEADRAGLVHTYTDSNNRHTEVMCNCCGCHCPVLVGLNRSPSPGNSAIVNWVVTIDDGTCTGCGLCVDRCWMSALRMSDTVVARDANRCIGCGVCIRECPVDALKLEHRTTF